MLYIHSNAQDGFFQFEETEAFTTEGSLPIHPGWFRVFLTLSAFSDQIRDALSVCCSHRSERCTSCAYRAGSSENLAAGIRDLYIRDYIDTWNGILASVAVKQAANAGELQESAGSGELGNKFTAWLN